MNTENLLNDVRDINLSYLLLMRRMIDTDRDMAMSRLDIDEDMADLLGSAPATTLSELAECTQLLCQFSPQESSQILALINGVNNSDKKQKRASLLMGAPDDGLDPGNPKISMANRRGSYRRGRGQKKRLGQAAQ